MPVAAGTRIGCFQILTPLGAGGMGEVYRARDTKLDREVAIKVLPEAKMSARVEHPDIAHICGVEDGALVTELVEGNEAKGPLEWDEAWKIASQIADVLEHARARGIIHRDLKPANIKVTADPGSSPTFTLYMAREQARGKTVDRRSDIWSFGAAHEQSRAGNQNSGKAAARTGFCSQLHRTCSSLPNPWRNSRWVAHPLSSSARAARGFESDAHQVRLARAAPLTSTGAAIPSKTRPSGKGSPKI